MKLQEFCKSISTTSLSNKEVQGSNSHSSIITIEFIKEKKEEKKKKKKSSYYIYMNPLIKVIEIK